MLEQGQQWKTAADKVLMSTYAQLPVVLNAGEGAHLIDVDGKSYLDFVSGIAVNALGHSDPNWVKKVQEQAATLVHVSNLYYNPPQIELALRLVAQSFADRVFFCNSGAEAVEAAIKLVRKFAYDKAMAENRPEAPFEIISAQNSFHGRTMAAITATGQAKFHQGFEPLLPGFSYVPFDDAAAIEKAIGPNTAAVLLEPIQGEGGVRVPKAGYLAQVRKICDRHGILLVFDEVQTGMGRTGTLFAYQGENVTPDIMTLAKGLGGGLPIGAMLATETVAKAFQPGSHASTFGGNPLVCTAAIEVIDRLCEAPLFLEQVREKGAYLIEGLLTLQDLTPQITEIRGRGLMVAIDLLMPSLSVIEAGLENGVLFNRTGEHTLRFVPPLNITKSEIDEMLEVLTDILMEQNDAEA